MNLEMLKLIMGMGEEPPIEALVSKVVGGGTTHDRAGDEEAGVLAIMVIPPHAKDPKCRLRLTLNGPTLLTPAMLKEMAENLAALASDPDIVEGYKRGKDMEPEAVEAHRQEQTQSAMARALG